MTPTALTPAARRAAAKRAAALEPATSHPRRVRRPAAPSAPRRVSGPVSRGSAAPRPSARKTAAPPRSGARQVATAAATAAGGAVIARPAQRPTRPQRPSKPQRQSKPRRPSQSRRPSGLTAAAASLGTLGPAIGRAVPFPRRQSGPLGARLAAGVRTMPEHRLIDGLVRGRAWIPVLGVMLAGIVFMQVETLKLGAGIGRSVQEASALGAQNQQLRASVATLGDDQRIESMAAQMGMIMPAPTAVGFLSTPTSAAKALAAMVAPSDTRFLSANSTNGTIALNNDLAQTGGLHAGAITIAPAPGTTGSATSPTLPSASAPAPSTGTSTTSTTGVTGAASTGTTSAGTPSAPSTGATTVATPSQSTSTSSSQTATQTGSTTPASGGAQLTPTTSQQSTGP